MKFQLVTILLIFTLFSCKLPYRALNGHKSNEIGYSVILLEENRYHLVYQAFDNHEYSELNNHLKRFSSELCLTDYKLHSFDENIIEYVTAHAPKKQPIGLTAVLTCDSINKTLLEKSYGSTIWFVSNGLDGDENK